MTVWMVRRNSSRSLAEPSDAAGQVGDAVVDQRLLELLQLGRPGDAADPRVEQVLQVAPDRLLQLAQDLVAAPGRLAADVRVVVDQAVEDRGEERLIGSRISAMSVGSESAIRTVRSGVGSEGSIGFTLSNVDGSISRIGRRPRRPGRSAGRRRGPARRRRPASRSRGRGGRVVGLAGRAGVERPGGRPRRRARRGRSCACAARAGRAAASGSWNSIDSTCSIGTQ